MKVCNIPYTWDFDSQPNSSPSKTTIPHDQAPAATPAVCLLTLMRSFSVLHFGPCVSSSVGMKMPLLEVSILLGKARGFLASVGERSPALHVLAMV